MLAVHDNIAGFWIQFVDLLHDMINEVNWFLDNVFRPTT